MAELVAVVDLGSTAVRFLLARIVPDSGYKVLVEERVPTRLGGGRPGILPREAIDETLKAVHKFFSRASGAAWGPRVVPMATSAVRGAAPGGGLHVRRMSLSRRPAGPTQLW